MHTLYGGAHLFKASSLAKLNALALKSYDAAIANPQSLRAHVPVAQGLSLEELAEVHKRTLVALGRGAIQDYRIDFEDGLGPKSPEDEVTLAKSAAHALCTEEHRQSYAGKIGIRTRAMSQKDQVLRVLSAFAEGAEEAWASRNVGLPETLALTLPKVTRAAEISEFIAAADVLRGKPWSPARLGFELMVEHPAALKNGALDSWVRTFREQVTSVHLGAYDLTAELGVFGPAQTLAHPYCEDARIKMQYACIGTNVCVSDGATNQLPLASPEQVEHGYKLHSEGIVHALSLGILQGWDLHPAQVAVRVATLMAYYRRHAKDCETRLQNFQTKAREATRVGATFDDEATGRTLEQFLERGRVLGAIN
jgi:hypothetical protein